MARKKKGTTRKRTTRKAFVTYLKFHRMKLGLTQYQVARAARISQGHYCEIEKGYIKPLPVVHKRIAEALGRPLDEFTGMLYGVNPAQMAGSGMAMAH
jgi:transcriptional regulator with XRE-family HTH domain